MMEGEREMEACARGRESGEGMCERERERDEDVKQRDKGMREKEMEACERE